MKDPADAQCLEGRVALWYFSLGKMTTGRGEKTELGRFREENHTGTVVKRNTETMRCL